MIHQSTNSDHAMDVIEFTTAEKNVKRNIGRRRVNGDTSRNAETNKLIMYLTFTQINKS